MKYVFEKKAGTTFHLDEWIAFLACLGECWNQPEISHGLSGDECCVTRKFTVTIETGSET